jgi:hypothetical protein
MTPYLNPEQVDALVGKLLANRPGGAHGTERKEIEAWLERPIGDLNPGSPGRPERELLTDPHGSRERLRNWFIKVARERNPNIDATLLDLWPWPNEPLTGAIDRKLKTWARRWHLNEPWVIERARKVLERRYELLVEMHFDKPTPWVTSRVLYWLDEAWKFDAVVRGIEPRMAAELIATTDTATRAPAVATRRAFNAPAPDPWRPDVTSASQYKTYIDGYVGWVREQVVALGWVKPLEKHEPLHFEWLVRFQIEGERQASIVKTLAIKYVRPRKTVHAGINLLARDIGLTRRK